MNYFSVLNRLSNCSQKAFEVLLGYGLTGEVSRKGILIHSDLIRLEYNLAEAASDSTFIEQLIHHPQDLDKLFLGKSVLLNRVLFKRIVDKCLSYISNTANSPALFSSWDHYLFKAHIQAQDSPEWFREAFWDINVHAINLVARSYGIVAPIKGSNHSGLSDGPLVFVFKCPPRLAHYFNLRSFLKSAVSISDTTCFRVIFLDVVKTAKLDLPCKIFYLGHLPLQEKINAYSTILGNTKASSVIWVASVQNLGLYMFSRIWPHQSYWSMKYHSIYSPTIDAYYKTSTTASRQQIDGNFWTGVPAKIDHLFSHQPGSTTNCYPQRIAKWESVNRPLPVLTLGRQIKISGHQYKSVAAKLLLGNVRLAYSGRAPAPWHELIAKTSPQNLEFLGWLKESQLEHFLGQSLVYLDSFPFGGGHTCFAALTCQTPILMLDTEQNRRCSFMMHLLDIAEFFGFNVVSPCVKAELGIFADPTDIQDFILSVSFKATSSIQALSKIQKVQYDLFARWISDDSFDSELKKTLAIMLRTNAFDYS